MNSGIEVDNKDLINALSNMSWKKMNSLYSKAMKKTLDPILKQTKVNLRKSGIKNVNKPYVSKDGTRYKSMLQGVKSSVFVKGNDEDSYGKVHIMGEFRLKFFEKGTSLRQTRKGWNRGSITPKWFFRNAVRSRQDEAVNTLDKNIRESIEKVWKRQ